MSGGVIELVCSNQLKNNSIEEVAVCVQYVTQLDNVCKTHTYIYSHAQPQSIK